jgi:predicted ArsR family transcriptional regulator
MSGDDSNDISRLSQGKKQPDRLNALGVLMRREIEVRILKPILEALGDEFGRERVLELTRETIIQIAREQGEQIAQSRGGNSLADFAASLEDWKKDDAMRIELLEQSEHKFFFNVTRCRYAELYQDLGIPELGQILSCNRDASLMQGFNGDIRLTRTQTIMEGAPLCDFRYELEQS